jgi:acetylornithine deacetylase
MKGNNLVMHEPLPLDFNRLEQLTQDLIDIYSPSGKEREVQHFIEKYLHRQGLQPQLIAVEAGRSNVVVAPQQSELLFLGHIDTVPAFDLENFNYNRVDDTIYGLGISDMKGACAAMIEAFCTFNTVYGRPPAATLALVVGEEETGDGARQLLKHYSAKYAVVGEPTMLLPCFGHYGYIEIELSSRGKRSHASMATSESHAVTAMLKSLLKIIGFIEESYPDSIYNIRDVSSSEAGFAVPDRCSAAIDLHIPPRLSAANVCEALAAQVDALNTGALTCEFSTVDEGYRISENSTVHELIAAVVPQHTATNELFRSHSDANQLWTAGIKPVILGPGSLAQAHTEHESMSFSQLCDAASIYYRLLCTLETRRT